MRIQRSVVVALSAAATAIVGFCLAADMAAAEGPPGSQNAPSSQCSPCHGNPGLKVTLPGGEDLSLYVNEQDYSQSVHGGILNCEVCHKGYAGGQHPPLEARTLFEYRTSKTTVCKTCHPGEYSQIQSSVHASLHGIGITCTDCHSAHDIQPAQAAALRAKTLALCTSCHENKQLMKQYGISTDVVSTYLSDFHGRTSLLLSKQGEATLIPEAVCIDCHGVHTILQVDSANSPVIKQNLTATCQKCHKDATPNFPSSWMSHYAPSLSNTPLVFLARWFYWIMIPFTILGLMIHVGIDLRHKVTARKETKR